MSTEPTNTDRPRRNGPDESLKKRKPKEIPWKTVVSDWKRLAKEAKYLGLDLDSQIAHADAEVEKLYGGATETQETKEIPCEKPTETEPTEIRSSAQITQEQQQPDTISPVTGLNRIPESWLPLPGNASLQAEIAWVQANRLLVVDERGDKTYVFLEKARNPAPSYAALGWLETSIKVYSKFVEVAAKATAAVANEEEGIKLERVAIDEVRRLLSEMLEAPSKENTGDS